MNDLTHRIMVDDIRTSKPRTAGVTIVLDTGLGPTAIADLGAVCGHACDFAKIAWGSALVTSGLEDKLARYRAAGIEPMLGGTLFEYAYANGRADDLLAYARENSLHIEISAGVVSLPQRDKLRWIERFSAHVPVFSEVGGKLAAHAGDWVDCIRTELEAGARKVVIEGREIGPANQEIRTDLVDLVLTATDSHNLVFEALERKQQVWLIKRLGPNVNLGNIRPAEAMALECYRRGLKDHTFIAEPRTLAPVAAGPG